MRMKSLWCRARWRASSRTLPRSNVILQPRPRTIRRYPLAIRSANIALVSLMNHSRSSLVADLRGMRLAFAYERPALFITRLSVRGLHYMFSSLDSMADIMSGCRVPAANPYAVVELPVHSNMVLRAAAFGFCFLRPLACQTACPGLHTPCGAASRVRSGTPAISPSLWAVSPFLFSAARMPSV